MRLTYDKEGDMAYLYIVDEISPGEAVNAVQIDDEQLGGDLVIDVDAHGRLLGIEIFNAREQLRAELLATATRLDEPGSG